MPEMFKTTEILFSRPELRTSVTLVTDGRFSGATDKGASMLRGEVEISRFRRAPDYFRKFPDRMRSRAVSMGCGSICRMRTPMY